MTEFITKIYDIAFGGEGVGRLPDGRVVFVPQTVVGDEVKIKITATAQRFLHGEIIEILMPGEGRKVPECPYFGQCGGCCYQHMTYETQIKSKENQLKSLLTRLGKVNQLPEIQVYPSDKIWNYRNKLRVSLEKNQQKYGFYTQDNETIIPITECKLASENINKEMQTYFKTPNVAYPTITFRQGSDGKVAFFGGNGKGVDLKISEYLFSGNVSVPIQSFWQVNPSISRQLIQETLAWLPNNISIFVDAYSGIGPFSLELGNRAKRHILIEIDPKATEMAKKLMHERQLGKPEVYNGMTEKILPKVLKTLGAQAENAIVLLDPPRTGCEKETTCALRQSSVKQILYISCHPATLARDLQRLGVDTGLWTINHIALFDMFPQTSHFETAILMTRTKK